MKVNPITNLSAKSIIIFCLFLFAAIQSPTTALAAGSFNFANDTGLAKTGGEAGYNSQNTMTPELIIGQAISLILGLLGVIFLAWMIWAGIEWMTAQGNDQKVSKAKDMITEAITGLIIVGIAYTIAYFIIQYFAATNLV